MANMNEEARIPVYINDDQAKSAIQNLTKEAEKWRKKMYEATAGGDMKGMKEAEKQLGLVNKQMSAIKKEAFDVNKVLKNISSASINDLRKASRALDVEMNKVNRGTKEYQALANKKMAIRAEFDKINGSLKTQTGLMGKLKDLLPLFGAAAVIGGLKSLFTNIINVRKEFEKYEAVLTNTLGSNRAARQEMQMLQKFAAETPFALTELTGAFVKLTNYGLKPNREELRKYGDIASSVGKGIDQLVEGVADAVTGEFERLKEFGIKAKKEGDKITFTFKEQTTVVDNNAQAIKGYITGLGDLQGVSGSMAAIAGTLGGRISNLGDAWDGLMNTFGSGTSGIMTTVIGWLTRFVSNIDGAFKSISDLKNIVQDQAIVEATKNGLMEIDIMTKSFMRNGVDAITAQERALKLYNASMDSAVKVALEDTREGSNARKTALVEEKAAVNKHFADVAALEKQQRENAAAVREQDAEKERKKKAEEDKKAFKKQQKDIMDDKPDKEEFRNADFAIAQKDIDLMKFAEKKRSEEEWTAFLDKEVAKQIAIKNKEYELDKEIAAAQLELTATRIDAIGQVAGSLSDMFEKGSAAQIAFMAIEKASAIAQIIFQTSIANAKAVAMSPLTFGQPWVSINTISAGASIAGIVAQTISQVSSTKKSGYADGGYTGSGGKYEPAGIVHRGEYVIPQEGLSNPTVRQAVSLFEMARRNNSYARLDLSPVARGFASGGFAGSSSSKSISNQINGVASPMGGMDTNTANRLADSIDRLTRWKPKIYTELIKKDLDDLNTINNNRGL